MLVHSVRRVPPTMGSSSHRISKSPHLYSSTLGASARVTFVSVTRGAGAPTVVSFTVFPTVLKLPSASKGAPARGGALRRRWKLEYNGKNCEADPGGSARATRGAGAPTE